MLKKNIEINRLFNHMKLIMESWRRYLKEGDEDLSNTLFFLKSEWGKEKGVWDHVGFILEDGNMKDMSGHRGEMVAPIISTWNDMRQDDEFSHIPETTKEAEDQGLYKTMSIGKTVRVPDGIVCRTDDPEKNSENCGSFVFNVLHNAGIDPSFLKSKDYMVVGHEF